MGARRKLGRPPLPRHKLTIKPGIMDKNVIVKAYGVIVCAKGGDSFSIGHRTPRRSEVNRAITPSDRYWVKISDRKECRLLASCGVENAGQI